MIVATDTDDVDGSDDDDDDEDNDSNTNAYDGGFSGEMNITSFGRLNSRLIYDDYQGTTTLPVSEAIGCVTRLGNDDGDIDLDDKGDYVSAAAHS